MGIKNIKIGESNPNWKGGKRLHTNGYVTVKVVPGSHLDIGNGYAYEHRVVAETKIGRQLLPGEEVHHINHDRKDNRPENLEVVTGEEHGVAHRTRNKGLRMPGEENPLIACECGCGTMFNKFDEYRRPRRFVSSHNAKRDVTNGRFN